VTEEQVPDPAEVAPARFERLTPRFPVGDLEATLGFYRDELGFEVDVRWPDVEPTFVILQKDAARVAFFTSEKAGSESRGGVELYIDVADAQALHDELAPRLSIAWGPEVYSYGCREFGVLDPDGYLVIFTESTTDPPTTREPLGG
jgi:catechol 2,3-dioxygenase-like lactoylglutathione lyase family enzyme